MDEHESRDEDADAPASMAADAPISSGAATFQPSDVPPPPKPQSAPPLPPPPPSPTAPPDPDEMRPLLRRLLDQTASLPSLGDQIGSSLEVFGDRLVDGLNEIFGNRLASIVDDMQAAIEAALGESRRQLTELEVRLDAVSTTAGDMSHDVRALLDRVEGLVSGGVGATGDALAGGDGEGDLRAEVAAVRRTLDKLDRAGTIRRKRIDQVRSRLDDVVESNSQLGDRTVAELAASRAAIDELSTWLGAVHTEVEELRDRVTSGALLPPPPPPADDTVPRELSEQVARLAEEVQLLRKRVPVRAAAPMLDDRQVQAIGDTVVNAIFEAVQLEPGELEEDADEAS